MAITELDITNHLKDMYPFNKLPELDRVRFAAAFEQVSLLKNDVLHELNTPANHLFIVYQGAIELNRLSDNNQMERFGVVETGEIFGLESLVYDHSYETQAKAITPVILLAIHQDILHPLLDEYDELDNLLNILLDSYYPLLAMRLSWRQEDEMVFWSSRKHPVFLWLRILTPLAIGVVFLAIYLYLLVSNTIDRVSLSIVFGTLISVVLLPAIYLYIDWMDDFYIITDRRVISRKRVILLYENKEEASFDAILSVNKRVNSVWGQLFGYGDIIMRTFTGAIEFIRIPNPEIINNLIEDLRSRRKKVKTSVSREEKMEEMRQRLGYANTSKAMNKNNTDTIPEADLDEGGFFSSLNHFTQSLFRLREVDGDQTTYRTHPLILLKHAGIPFIIAMSTLVYFIFVLLGLSILDLPDPPDILNGLAALIGVGAFLVCVYQYIDWRNDRYIVNDRQIIDLYQKPFGREDRRSAPITNIQTVEYKRKGFFGIVFNYGTVSIRVGDTEFTFDNVANPADVQGEIANRLEAAKERERQAEIKRERDTILDWIEVYHQTTHQKDQNDGASNPTFFSF